MDMTVSHFPPCFIVKTCRKGSSSLSPFAILGRANGFTERRRLYPPELLHYYPSAPPPATILSSQQSANYCPSSHWLHSAELAKRCPVFAETSRARPGISMFRYRNTSLIREDSDLLLGNVVVWWLDFLFLNFSIGASPSLCRPDQEV